MKWSVAQTIYKEKYIVNHIGLLFSPLVFLKRFQNTNVFWYTLDLNLYSYPVRNCDEIRRKMQCFDPFRRSRSGALQSKLDQQNWIPLIQSSYIVYAIGKYFRSSYRKYDVGIFRFIENLDRYEIYYSILFT